MPTKGSTKFPKASVSVGEVTRVELNSAVSKLDTAIAALPTTATTDAIKTDVTKLKSDLTALDTSKASAADVAKLDTATKALDKAIKDLAALPVDVTQAELDAAVAEYNAKLKTANDAIAGVKTSADKASTDITTLAATVASNKTAQDTAVADTTAKLKTANDAIAAVETAYKAGDKTLTDKNTAQDTAIAAVKTTADKAATDIAALSTTVSNNKTSQDKAIASAIAEWAADRSYRVDNIVIRNRTFFYCLTDNSNKDPLTDKSGNWSIFVPNETNSIFANRSPAPSDVYATGVKWYDVSWGSDTPLIYLSLGSGAWTPLNQITLSKIRFFCNGSGSTYRSKIGAIKFYRSDWNLISNSSFVWGAGSGLGKTQDGVAYAGQQVNMANNKSGWFDIEPSATFDLSQSIIQIKGSLEYGECNTVDLYYSNGGKKRFTSTASGGGSYTERNIVTFDPAIPARYGDAIAGVLGETLTSAKLTNPANTDAGRMTGESFVAAFNTLYNAQPQVLAAYQQATIDDLTARIAELEKKVP